MRSVAAASRFAIVEEAREHFGAGTPAGTAMRRASGVAAAIGVSFGLATVCPPLASAGVVLGQVPAVAPSFANSPPLDSLQPVVVGANSYVVPAGGGTITEWHTFGANIACSKCAMTLLVLRPAGGNSYTVIAHDGPRPITSNVLNTFGGLAIPVQAGDVVGLRNVGGEPTGDAPVFRSPVVKGPGETNEYLQEAWLAHSYTSPEDGLTFAFSPSTGGYLLNLSVQLGEPAPGSPPPPPPTGEKAKEKPKEEKVGSVGTPEGTVEVSGGSVKVTVECKGEPPCSVEASLSSSSSGHAARASRAKKPKPILLARVKATIPGGKRQRLVLKLTKAGKSLLRAHHGHISAKLLITGTAGAAQIDVSRTVVVRSRRGR